MGQVPDLPPGASNGYPIMDMDERLEALARKVENIAGMRRENQARFEKLTHDFENVLDSIKRLEIRATARRPKR